MNKKHAYNRIAKATIKALKEQADTGKVNTFNTDAVYQAIDSAFQKEYADLAEQLDKSQTALKFIAQGQELDKEQIITLAVQSLAQA